MYTPKRSFQKEKFRTTHTHGSPFNDDVKTPTKSSSLQVIEKGENHELMRMSSGLPVNVSEEIAKVDTNRLCCSIEPNGWCYLLSIKKLFLWKLISSNILRKATSCLEFQLPPTELHHKISLVCLSESSGENLTQIKTSLLIVAPEGVVRYWPDVNKPSLFNEVNMNLAGKSCHSVFSLKPYGYILVTTTNELYALNPTMSSINVQALSSQAGMLSSISRRVSSFWVTAPAANKYSPCICDGTLDYDEDERYFFVIVDNMLQKWEISGHQVSSAKMTNQYDLFYHLKIQKDQDGVELSRIDEIFAIDAKNTGSGLIILMSAILDGQQTFLLGAFKLAGEVCFDYIISLGALSGSDLPSMVIPTGSYRATMHLKRIILSVQLSKYSKNHVAVEFDSSNQALIGSGFFSSNPVFLCRRNGLISLNIKHYESPIKIPEAETTGKKMEVEFTESLDATDALSQAFKEYSKTETIYSSSRWSPFSIPEMCNAVVSISESILNSSPATEPRWSSAGQKDFDNSSQPLLLFNQLKDKENVHGVYLKFLKSSNIWDEVLQHSNNVKYMLTDHGEKLHCTMGLLDLYNEFSEQIDDVIGSSDISGDIIRKKDTFFSRVTDIGMFFSVLVQKEISFLQDTNIIQKHIENIIAVGEILTKSYIASWRFRQTIMDQYNLSADHHVPWTGNTKEVNNRNLLMKQIKIIFENALGSVDSTKLGSLLTQQVVLLADFLLDGFDKEIRLMKTKSGVEYDEIFDEFQEKRRFIIQSLVNFGYLEDAMTLAEKYEDFSMLISLCERSNDVNKLEQYKVMFKDQGFLDVLYRWYMEQGNWGKLMSMRGAGNEEFSNFLSNHSYLSWIHHIGIDQYSQASVSLKSLANDENIFSGRKKMMLVLSSLSALASEDPNAQAQYSEIEEELEVIDHQNRILVALGKDIETQQPNRSEDVIEQCLRHRDNIMEECYPSVFHLINSVKDENRQNELLLSTWCKCILYDEWTTCALLQLNAVVIKKIFTQALQFCSKNDSYKHLITPLSSILQTSTEISDRANDDVSFLQQLKACYEIVQLEKLSTV